MSRNIDYVINLEKESNSVTKFYSELGIRKMSKKYISLNHTEFRVLKYVPLASFTLGFPLIFAILTYNTMNLSGLIFTIIFIIIIQILYIYRSKILNKTIDFDIEKGFVIYRNKISQKRVTLKNENIQILSKTHSKKNYSSKYYYLLDIKEKKTYSLFTGYIFSSDVNKLRFIEIIKDLTNIELIRSDNSSKENNNIGNYKYEVFKDYIIPIPDVVSENSEIFDINKHSNWHKFRFKDSNLKNTWIEYKFQNGKSVFMLTDCDGVGYGPQDNIKHTIISHKK